MIDAAITELEPLLGTRAACAATGRPQANHYRRHRASPASQRPPREHRPQPRALTPDERTRVRAVLNSPEHVDKAPATVYHELLDDGTYLASVSTMYRVLRAHDEVKDRRRHAVHPARVKPEPVATKPNQCWSWDITKLHGPAKWSYYHLYVIIDIYSRYVVGWLIAESESAALAEKLPAETIAKHDIDRDQLTIHADNGSSMASKPVAFLLADLGVTKTHSLDGVPCGRVVVVDDQRTTPGAVDHPGLPDRPSAVHRIPDRQRPVWLGIGLRAGVRAGRAPSGDRARVELPSPSPVL